MKMVTKTFQKTNDAMLDEIEPPVTAALVAGYSFHLHGSSCYLARNDRSFIACATPEKLLHAWRMNKPITFSVTLPERYWK